MLTELLNKYPLRQIIQSRGYCKRADAIKSLADTDLLYLGVFSGRVYDCLMSGKPVLGVLRESGGERALYSPDMISLVKNYEYGQVFSDNEDNKIFSYIHDLCIKSLNGQLHSNFDISKAEKYSTSRMASEYARLLDRLLK